jgi:2-polyprenyl-3-methyl-5-hydroxy-6-metoxy-1,4-benzoquinol methylase
MTASMAADLGLVCPGCRSCLHASEEGYVCPDCGQQWFARDGVLCAPNFDASVYWSEIPRPSMRHILSRAGLVGASQALREWADEHDNEYLARYALDPRRSLCLELAGIPAGATVVDYGCGWGTIGLCAAPVASRVFLVDSTLERARFASMRAKELGAGNVLALGVQEWADLPIARGSVDVLVLNGVLEWIPMSREGDPARIQRDFLRDMYELLAPGGHMYIGIENRLSLRYVAGYPDDHSGVKFTTLIPRWLADVVMRSKGQRGYRTPTLSLWEWRRVLRGLDGAKCSIYAVTPDYRYPQAACDVEDAAGVGRLEAVRSRRRAGGRQIALWLAKARLWPLLTYSYGVVVAKTREDAPS